MFTLVNLFFCHACLIHVTVGQIQLRVCMSPCSVQAAAELLLFYCVRFFFELESFQSYFLASFLASQLKRLMAGPALEFSALFEEEHNLATEIGGKSIELRCKSESHRFVTNAYLNQAITSCFEQKDEMS